MQVAAMVTAITTMTMKAATVAQALVPALVVAAVAVVHTVRGIAYSTVSARQQRSLLNVN
jgi:hypothetical protein